MSSRDTPERETRARLSTGQCEDAHARHAAALSLSSQGGNKLEQARAHNGLDCIYSTGGDAGLARRHWQKALTIRRTRSERKLTKSADS
jgi:hypothetical protein